MLTPPPLRLDLFGGPFVPECVYQPVEKILGGGRDNLPDDGHQDGGQEHSSDDCDDQQLHGSPFPVVHKGLVFDGLDLTRRNVNWCVVLLLAEPLVGVKTVKEIDDAPRMSEPLMSLLPSS